MQDDGIGIEFEAGGGAAVTIDPATATVIVREGRFRRILSYDEAILLAVRRFHSPVRTALARA